MLSPIAALEHELCYSTTLHTDCADQQSKLLVKLKLLKLHYLFLASSRAVASIGHTSAFVRSASSCKSPICCCTTVISSPKDTRTNTHTSTQKQHDYHQHEKMSMRSKRRGVYDTQVVACCSCMSEHCYGCGLYACITEHCAITKH
jgi:hypothetical protein